MIEELLSKPIDYSQKSLQQRAIDGEFGPVQRGVVTYPYSHSEKLYKDSFRAVVSGRLTHPYITTTVAGSGSIPFDLLSGSNCVHLLSAVNICSCQA